jgi:LPS export ABC transporter protein LptC
MLNRKIFLCAFLLRKNRAFRGSRRLRGRFAPLQSLAPHGLFRFFCFALILVTAGCSINYREGQITDELEDTIPNIRMVNLRHRVATKDRIIMEMTVERSESYEGAKKIMLFGVNFREYGESGEVTTEGRADTVVYHTDTKNAEIAGNIEIVSHKEEGGIRTQHLYWDDARRFLSAAPDEETEIFDEDGSQFSGKGFEADIKRLIISFLDAVDGDFITEDGETENENTGAADLESREAADFEIAPESEEPAE